MLIYLSKNFGLTALAFAVLFVGASLEIRLESIEGRLAQAEASTIALGSLAGAVPSSALK